jgi:hypothetical protein
VKEHVVLDTLMDSGAQISSQKNPIGFQQSINNSNQKLSNSESHSYASIPLKPFHSPGDEDTMQQKKKRNTKKITSRMIVSGTLASFPESDALLSHLCCHQDGLT